MTKIFLIGLVAVLCLFLAACSPASQNVPAEPEPPADIPQAVPVAPQQDPLPAPPAVPEEQKPPEDISQAAPKWQEPAVLTDDRFDFIFARFCADELVRTDTWHQRLENAALLDEWIESYRLGIPGKIAILVDGGPFPSNFFILKSDGSATYVITAYYLPYGSTSWPAPRTFESSQVIRTAYTYGLGTDVQDLDEIVPYRMWPVHISNYTFDRSHHERLEWNPLTDAPLGEITLQQAELRVKELYAADGLDLPFLGWEPRIYFRTVGAIYLGENIYYLVYGHSNLEGLERGEHIGSVSAVGLDGRLVFMQDMAHGQWWLWDDAMREVITP